MFPLGSLLLIRATYFKKCFPKIICFLSFPISDPFRVDHLPRCYLFNGENKFIEITKNKSIAIKNEEGIDLFGEQALCQGSGVNLVGKPIVPPSLACFYLIEERAQLLEILQRVRLQTLLANLNKDDRASCLVTSEFPKTSEEIASLKLIFSGIDRHADCQRNAYMSPLFPPKFVKRFLNSIHGIVHEWHLLLLACPRSLSQLL